MGSTTALATSSGDRASLEGTPCPAAGWRADGAGAVEGVVAAHQQRIAQVVAGLLGNDEAVEDVVQDVFVSALENRKRFRGQCEFSTWLTAIAVNKCRSYRRRQAIRRNVFGWLTRHANVATLDALQTEAAEARQRVRQAVERLPSKYREPIVLRYFEEYSIEEIGQSLSLSRNAVEARLSRGRGRLRKMLSVEEAG